MQHPKCFLIIYAVNRQFTTVIREDADRAYYLNDVGYGISAAISSSCDAYDNVNHSVLPHQMHWYHSRMRSLATDGGAAGADRLTCSELRISDIFQPQSMDLKISTNCRDDPTCMRIHHCAARFGQPNDAGIISTSKCEDFTCHCPAMSLSNESSFGFRT